MCFLDTAQNVPVVGDFLIRIFSILSLNAGKYGLVKLQIRTFFTQWKDGKFNLSENKDYNKITA